jgi:nucleoid DNA-binding protein
MKDREPIVVEYHCENLSCILNAILQDEKIQVGEMGKHQNREQQKTLKNNLTTSEVISPTSSIK